MDVYINSYSIKCIYTYLRFIIMRNIINSLTLIDDSVNSRFFLNNQQNIYLLNIILLQNVRILQCIDFMVNTTRVFTYYA